MRRCRRRSGCGYAEPDPRRTSSGADAAEKLAVLLQHFARLRRRSRSRIETAASRSRPHAGSRRRREFGGVIKPVVSRDWSAALEAFVGPAFVPHSHPLSRVDGVENALRAACARAGGCSSRGPAPGLMSPRRRCWTMCGDRRRDGEARAHAALSDARAVRRRTPAGCCRSPEPRVCRAAPTSRTTWGPSASTSRTAPPAARGRAAERRCYLTGPRRRHRSSRAAARCAGAAGCRISRVRALGELE